MATSRPLRPCSSLQYQQTMHCLSCIVPMTCMHAGLNGHNTAQLSHLYYGVSWH